MGDTAIKTMQNMLKYVHTDTEYLDQHLSFWQMMKQHATGDTIKMYQKKLDDLMDATCSLEDQTLQNFAEYMTILGKEPGRASLRRVAVPAPVALPGNAQDGFDTETASSTGTFRSSEFEVVRLLNNA